MIISFGEALIDMIPAQSAQEQKAYVPCAGGSPYNVALALGRLGAPTGFCTRLSNDQFGRLLAETLEASGVDISLCPRVDALSTLGFVTLPDTGEPEYAFYTQGTADTGLMADDLPKNLNPNDLLHFGSISLTIEPMGTTLSEYLIRASEQHRISLDPNVRPFMIANRGKYLERLERLIEKTHILKISAADLAWLYPNEEPEIFAKRVLEGNTELVVITDGEKGAHGYTRYAHGHAPIVSVDVIDTVGAGDTFQAGILYKLKETSLSEIQRLNNSDIEKILSFSAQAAAITCSRQGCHPPYIHELI